MQDSPHHGGYLIRVLAVVRAVMVATGLERHLRPWVEIASKALGAYVAPEPRLAERKPRKAA